MTKYRTPTPVYLDPGMHSGLEVKGLNTSGESQSADALRHAVQTTKTRVGVSDDLAIERHRHNNSN